jgi:beta-mannosidase
MGGDPYHDRILSDEEKESFGVLPDKIKDFILATQITQAEAQKFFIEMTRLNKWQSTGLLWWNVMRYRSRGYMEVNSQ